MIAGLRERLGGLPAPVAYGLVLALLVGAGVVFYLQQTDAAPPRTALRLEEKCYRWCLRCGAAFEDAVKDLVARGQLDAVEHEALLGEGLKCSKCRQNTLALAVKCPRDGTVFVPGVATRGASRGAGCPKCGWDASRD
jgi:hypothetical protein